MGVPVRMFLDKGLKTDPECEYSILRAGVPD